VVYHWIVGGSFVCGLGQQWLHAGLELEYAFVLGLDQQQLCSVSSVGLRRQWP
jgi:hypothetical protein